MATICDRTGIRWTASWYATKPYRIEYRLFSGPHTQEELVVMLDNFQAAGAQAWWYSVAAKGYDPLFPSNVLPYRDNAVDCYSCLVA